MPSIVNHQHFIRCLVLVSNTESKYEPETHAGAFSSIFFVCNKRNSKLVGVTISEKGKNMFSDAAHCELFPFCLLLLTTSTPRH